MILGTKASVLIVCTGNICRSPTAEVVFRAVATREAPDIVLEIDSAGTAGDIQWNFEKFLIGRDGRILRRYPSGTRPEDKGLLADLARAASMYKVLGSYPRAVL